jgi:hypothetical protein
MAATKGDELIVEHDSVEGSRSAQAEVGWRSKMDVEEIQEKFGSKQIRCQNL